MYTATKFSTAVPSSNGRTTIRVAAASARPHGLNRGIGSHGQAKRRVLSSYGHIFAERNENEHDAICKDRKDAARVAVRALALVSLLSLAASTRARDVERPYPTMLPLSQYLMDRDAAIALARSAAPEGISKDASVLVLTPKGWERRSKVRTVLCAWRGRHGRPALTFMTSGVRSREGRFASILRLCGRSCRFFAS